MSGTEQGISAVQKMLLATQLHHHFHIKPFLPIPFHLLRFLHSVNYMTIVGRYIGWFFPLLTAKRDDSKQILSVLRISFAQWGIPVEFTTDGAFVYVSEDMEEVLSRYVMGVKHRVSSNYYPRGNKRSDVLVKSAKQLVMDNLSPNGSLYTDRFMRALLIHRN